MKTIVDFLKEHTEYKEQFGNYEVLFEYHYPVISVTCENKKYDIPAYSSFIACDRIQEFIEGFDGTEIRFCDECGKPYDKGFIAGDGDWYCCEDCFDGAMNETYGEGKWRGTDKEGSEGGYYEYFDGEEWEDTGIFYTEWN